MPPTHSIEGIEAARPHRNPRNWALSQFADDDYAFELLELGVGGLGLLRSALRVIRVLQEFLRRVRRTPSEALLARKSHEEPSALLGLSAPSCPPADGDRA